ncbi:hypothetical protein [uncultured Roseobacter sp.]|nr:hypothetical protein [uncultured Roseobacter sp.]
MSPHSQRASIWMMTRTLDAYLDACYRGDREMTEIARSEVNEAAV